MDCWQKAIQNLRRGSPQTCQCELEYSDLGIVHDLEARLQRRLKAKLSRSKARLCCQELTARNSDTLLVLRSHNLLEHERVRGLGNICELHLECRD